MPNSMQILRYVEPVNYPQNRTLNARSCFSLRTPDPWKGSTAYVSLKFSLLKGPYNFLLTENVLPFQAGSIGSDFNPEGVTGL
jgi:hypothetical protein